MRNTIVVAAALSLSVAALAGEAVLLDETVPEGALQGPSSTRLARDVEVRFGHDYNELVQLMDGAGKKVTGTSAEPDSALKAFTLSVARRHFEDASWSKLALKKAKKGKQKGREIVIQRVSVIASPGPSYRVTVVVDRVQNGRRLGQGTGQGFAMPDRTKERTSAAFAPGLLGYAMANKAMKASPDKDAAAIQTAVLQALDSACLQLAAAWSGEQMLEDMNRKRR